MKPVQLAVLAACLCAVSAGYLPERIVKKYAMKKITEDCFGKEVMTNIKREMFAAHIKCSGDHSEGPPAAAAIFGGDSRRKRSARHFSGDKLKKMRDRIASFVGNATCVFRELKMLDAENKVDVDSMKERVNRMPVEESLKNDLHESLDACYEFSNCLPESFTDKPAALMGFGRQMMFFKCFKEAKLESCMKKTFREDYLPMLVEESMPEDEDETFYTFLVSHIVGEKGGH